MARRASNSYMPSFKRRFRRGVGQRCMASTAKREWLKGIRVFEVFIFPCCAMERLLPFRRDFRMTIPTPCVRGQTNARNGLKICARRWTWQRNVICAARARDEHKRACNGDADAQEIETQTHGLQDAGNAPRLSTSILGVDFVHSTCNQGDVYAEPFERR